MEIFSPGHLLVLAVVVLVLFFGWKQLPDMARSLGRSLRIFKTEIKGMTEDGHKRPRRCGQEDRSAIDRCTPSCRSQTTAVRSVFAPRTGDLVRRWVSRVVTPAGIGGERCVEALGVGLGRG